VVETEAGIQEVDHSVIRTQIISAVDK